MKYIFIICFLLLITFSIAQESENINTTYDDDIYIADIIVTEEHPIIIGDPTLVQDASYIIKRTMKIITTDILTEETLSRKTLENFLIYNDTLNYTNKKNTTVINIYYL